MRFINSILFVLFSSAAKVARVVYFGIGVFAGAAVITAGVAAYSAGVQVHMELAPEFGVLARVIAVGSAIGAVVASAVVAALVVGAARLITELLSGIAKRCEQALERSFTPAPTVQAKVEPQLELPLPAVEREPNRRVPRRDVEPFPRAAH
jgi:hypothetical protein